MKQHPLSGAQQYALSYLYQGGELTWDGRIYRGNWGGVAITIRGATFSTLYSLGCTKRTENGGYAISDLGKWRMDPGARPLPAEDA